MTQLSRDRIVHAAVNILQTYGLQDLSIRKVATQLGVQPGALYWHFPNKQALLGAICLHILTATLPSPTPTEIHAAEEFSPLHVTTSARWQQELVIIADDLRNRALSYRDGAELLSAALAANSTIFPHLTDLTETLTKVSPTPEIYARALLLFMLGALVDEQTRRQLAELADTHSPATASAEVLEAGLGAFFSGLA